jgi:hypothetical protein
VPKHLTLQDRILAWAKKTRAHAEELEYGPAKKAMLEKVAQAEKASVLDNWSEPPALRPK